MSMTVSDITQNAGLFRRAYPDWPHAEPAPVLPEVTIAWGDDTRCTDCECLLPACAPAWADGENLHCADCA